MMKCGPGSESQMGVSGKEDIKEGGRLDGYSITWVSCLSELIQNDDSTNRKKIMSLKTSL